MRKKRILGLALACVTALGLLSGCGGGGGGLLSGTQAGDGSKVLNIYVWNEEFQGKFNENYPEVERLSNDKSVAYLKDGTEVHWIVNPTQDGVCQQKLDEALLKQGRAAADERVDMFLVEADYALKYVDPEVNVALPISRLGITDGDIANQYRYTLEAMTGSDVAATVDLSNISSYDQGCVEEFQNTFGDYFNGKISLDKAKANFEMSITERYPWLVGGGVEWP